WSSDVCSSDLEPVVVRRVAAAGYVVGCQPMRFVLEDVALGNIAEPKRRVRLLPLIGRFLGVLDPGLFGSRLLGSRLLGSRLPGSRSLVLFAREEDRDGRTRTTPLAGPGKDRGLVCAPLETARVDGHLENRRS